MSLVTISTSDTDAWVSASVDFVIVCPISLLGSPLILYASITSLLTYSADEGFTINSSRSTILVSKPYKTLNNILKDSSVPLDWYKDFDYFIKLLTSRLDTKSVSSKPGVKDVLIFL